MFLAEIFAGGSTSNRTNVDNIVTTYSHQDYMQSPCHATKGLCSVLAEQSQYLALTLLEGSHLTRHSL